MTSISTFFFKQFPLELEERYCASCFLSLLRKDSFSDITRIEETVLFDFQLAYLLNFYHQLTVERLY